MGFDSIRSVAGPDEAIDLLCETPEGEIIVQCKKWKRKVGVPIIREVFGAAMKRKARSAVIVTLSEFTEPAEQFTIDLRIPIRLIDGKELFDLMSQHMPDFVAETSKKSRS